MPHFCYDIMGSKLYFFGILGLFWVGRDPVGCQRSLPGRIWKLCSSWLLDQPPWICRGASGRHLGMRTAGTARLPCKSIQGGCASSQLGHVFQIPSGETALAADSSSHSRFGSWLSISLCWDNTLHLVSECDLIA